MGRQSTRFSNSKEKITDLLQERIVMSFFKRSLILGFFVCTLLSGAVFASLEESTMEQGLMDKAQRVLDGLYGKGNFIVLASVSMTDPRYEVKYTRQSQAQSQ